jgi:hypothetical protein
MNIYFSDAFGVTEAQLEKYGAFNISVIVDLPLFVDPFLLFDSPKPEYRKLHDDVIDYLRFLRDLSQKGSVREARIRHLYCFREVEQNWLGFSQAGNSGRGLGMGFARALSENLNSLFPDFGAEQITKGSHLEKLCLIREGVGRDMISDFTTNLIKEFLCEYTQKFAIDHIDPSLLAEFAVPHVRFSSMTQTWRSAKYTLPKLKNDFVLLTPKEILTKDEAWINKEDYYREYHDIPTAIGNDELRAQINSYFASVLPNNPNKKDQEKAVRKTTLKFPALIDYFIKYKESTGADARKKSLDKVEESTTIYIRQFGALIDLLQKATDFYTEPLDSRTAAREKALFLKDVIENKGGHRIFYNKGIPIQREVDLQILYRLVWHGTSFDVSREVNDGRGPADFKISRGAQGKTLVEMKLASNAALRRNLEKQAPIYQKASDAEHAVKVILYFTDSEAEKIKRTLKDLKIDKSEDIILIDARWDNKISGSKA